MNTENLPLSNDEAQHLEDLIEGLGEGNTTPILNAASEVGSINTSEYRLKSPLKMRYSAEVEIIKKKWGNLEDIRKHLGLSQRKISQLLMVDPSAWTRWTKYDHEAPPHIYRSLSWFLQLQEKDPVQSSPYNYLQAVSRPSLPKSEILSIGEEIHSAIKNRLALESQGELQKVQLRMMWLLFTNGALIAGLILILLLRVL